MRRRLKFLLVGACALVAIVALYFFCLRENEPSYDGRTLSEWLERYAPTYDSVPAPAQKKEAAQAVRVMGTNCIPALLDWNARREAAWRINAAQMAAKVSSGAHDKIVRSYLWAGSAERHHDLAESGFSILGTNAATALPELQQQFNDSQAPDGPERAARIIASLGPTGVNALLEVATYDDHESQRHFALRALPNNHLPAKAEPILLGIVKTGDVESMAEAVGLLQQFRAHAPEIALVLTGVLDSADVGKRRQAAEMLRFCGTEVKPAIRGLVKLLADTNEETRQTARATLQYIAPEVLTNSAAVKN